MKANLEAHASSMLTRGTGTWRLDTLRGYAAAASNGDDCRGFHLRSELAAPLMICVFLLCSASRTIYAQIPQPPLPVDPTPLSALLSDADKLLLQQARGAKKEVEAYLAISDRHLDAAAIATENSNFPMAERELDIYNKAIAQSSTLAFSQDIGRRDMAKRIEQRIYKQLRILESIQRRFPVERVRFADDAVARSKRLRSHALNEAIAKGEVLTESEDKKPEDPPHEDASPGAAKYIPLFTVNVRRVSAQLGADYLTEEEDNHVREAQQIDQRTRVFIKIADRRLAALTGEQPPPDEKNASKKGEDEKRQWGVLPKLSRAELLQQYARAVEELIAKLEDAHERNPKSSAIPKALTELRDATDRQLQRLHSLEASMKDDAESRALRQAISQAETANQGAKDGLKK